MKRKKIIAGNWKMNLDKKQSILLIEELNNLEFENDEIEKIIFPSAIFLEQCKAKINDRFRVGSQNISHNSLGAFTGQVHAKMVASIGCNYTLVGHSECRMYLNENNAMMVEKIRNALQENLKIIYCIGEELTLRNDNTHFNFLKTQLVDVLQSFNEQELQNISIAYEPIWAIGTGVTATTDQAQEACAFIRIIIAEIFNIKTSNQISILYGGSCNAQNAAELFSCLDIDGGLIGGASLKANEFYNIYKALK